MALGGVRSSFFFFANETTCSSFPDLTGFSLFSASGRTVGFDLLDTLL